MCLLLLAPPPQVKDAVQPNVAVVVYDWKNFTLHEIVRYIKKAIGIGKVMSVGVVAPGDTPGCVCEWEPKVKRGSGDGQGNERGHLNDREVLGGLRV